MLILENNFSIGRATRFNLIIQKVITGEKSVLSCGKCTNLKFLNARATVFKKLMYTKYQRIFQQIFKLSNTQASSFKHNCNFYGTVHLFIRPFH